MSDSPTMHMHAESMLDDPSTRLLNDKPKNKWRIAVSTIFCIRALLSLLNQITKTNFITSSSPVSSNSTFNVDQIALTRLVKNKDLAQLQELGGVEGVALHLKSDKEHGIPCHDAEDIPDRIKEFGSNVYRKAPKGGFFRFVWEAFKDPTVLILLGCAALSLGFDINEHGFKEGCTNGGTILLAVIQIISVSAVSDYRQSRPLVRNNIQIEAWRGGRRQKISVSETVVGDVILLNIGDRVPADGLLVQGHSLQVDESSMTGTDSPVEISYHQNPFLFSGTKITHGYGRMLVTSVGMNTTWGEMMSQMRQDSSERTPLQERLEKLNSLIGKAALLVAFLLLVVLLVRYFTGNTKDENGNKEFNGSNTEVDDIISAVIGIVAAAVSIVVVAIPEGLSLALILAVAYSKKIMMADKAMDLKLSACETMGSVTTICTDKTGTLTMNQMEVTQFWLGKYSLEEEAYSSEISLSVLHLIQEGVALNTTGSVHKQSLDSKVEISGSPTEKAIISWGVFKLQMDMEKVMKSCSILHVEAFDSQNMRSGVSMKRNAENTVHVHWKGAAEIILEMCSSYYNPSGFVIDMGDSEKMSFEEIIQGMAASRLRCIAFAHKEVPADQDHTTKLKEDGLTLLGLVGLKDPCRPEAKKAVEDCQYAGVNVKMITGDNIFTAKAIATECGILKSSHDIFSGAVINGVEFRSYTDLERMLKLDNICVMARSSAADKLLMVRCLKQKGHVVAVTGHGATDAPALEEADIGLSMGIQGTEVAKESSDIIITDDNFASVVSVLACGRCVYHNTQKLVQFQLTSNVAGLLINFAVAASSRQVPFTIVRSIWLNMIMDTLLALALTKDKPTKELMERPPVGRTEPFITNVMCRNLFAQALYQTTVLLILQFRGEAMFGVNDKVNGTLIFNTFVFCQMFNEFNARKLVKKDIFRNIHTDKLFMGIIAVAVILQIVTVEFLSKFEDIERLNYRLWGVCLGIAAISWPIGWVVKCIPVPQKPIFHYLKMKMH
ncbi:putative calcium-transporting ATPase 13, plasma membrane-type [Rosa rugosa]|uniref:putative calcium-transporting ATPase 13, plasma membrane-type n=1 Tax=Rosa rugosa TaxID=74645 RepID=UPI002B40BD01|nr:putative calcium-transporting ATPase 13, plasma membrane-type [Rosa rugosa]